MLNPTAVLRYHRQSPFHSSGPVPVRAKSRYQKQHQCVLNVVYCQHGGVHGGPTLAGRGRGRGEVRHAWGSTGCEPHYSSLSSVL